MTEIRRALIHAVLQPLALWNIDKELDICGERRFEAINSCLKYLIGKTKQVKRRQVAEASKKRRDTKQQVKASTATFLS